MEVRFFENITSNDTGEGCSSESKKYYRLLFIIAVHDSVIVVWFFNNNFQHDVWPEKLGALLVSFDQKHA